ncbi:GmrSD restriction endonuclease domain-containing protein [Thalassospira alkalitolerans]|uniref:GmrSD restriction endonuclease domain-containing protein n=1 Tax=Thalassospira alkalitolerans TaxID=1293890 RepID=UPI0030EC8927|tara:strand:- start:51442 stop:53238 length:1797 start_codon:yes stop_codon:yes gene_type:complete
MATQRYSVTPHPIETLLTWVKSGEIAIPEIQRPFVWDATKVRNLLDSLYQGYPVGYLIAWRNPSVRLKDGSSSSGKRILIDGQQRVTALMAALLGREVLTKDYETVRIRIAFHPVEEKFEVSNPAIQKDVAWIPDLAEVFAPDASLTKLTRDYATRNPDADQDEVSIVLERVRKIINNHVGFIELAEDLDIETVTEIFIRVNSAGASLSQADFAMSKIAANDTYGGNMLRKAIDYFCHLAIAPEFLSRIEKGDKAFAASEFLPKMRWLKDVNDDLYDPSYTDMLRVAFTSEFRRGKLQDLVALLSGRNFETKQYEETVAEESFAKLKTGVLNFINKTHFDRLTMILRSAGFITSKLIRSQNAINFAYILYLRGRGEGMPAADIERLVRRWYVMSLLRGRYSGSPETTFDFDIRQIETQGLAKYTEAVIEAELPESFWTTLLPQEMDTSSGSSPYFLVYQAAQAKLGDLGFLSRDITVRDLLLNRSDVHHVYPRNLLKKQGMTRGRYNQIANFVLAQSEINIGIGDRAPEVYFAELAEQCNGRSKKHGGITDLEELRANLAMSCLPESLLTGEAPDYGDFLEMRRKLMAQKIKTYFEGL